MAIASHLIDQSPAIPGQAKSEAILPQLKTFLLERLELGGGRDLANTCLDASAANRYRAGATIPLFARILRLVSQFADRVLERGALLDFDALAVVRQLGTAASAAGVAAAAEECIGRSDESDGEDSEGGSDACVHGIGGTECVGIGMEWVENARQCVSVRRRGPVLFPLFISP